MKNIRTAVLVSSASLALLLTSAAYAGEGDHSHHDDWHTLTAVSTSKALEPSYGTPVDVLSADTQINLTVKQDGSLDQSSIQAARDENVAFHVSNSSNQPVRIVIDGEGAEPVNVGQVAAGQSGDFAWRFDSWNALPKAIKIGQATAKVYVTFARFSN